LGPLIRKPYVYEVIEGLRDLPSKVKVSRVDRGQLDDDETSDVVNLLKRYFPAQQFHLGYPIPDSSGEESVLSVGLSETERRRRKTPPGVREVVTRLEIEKILQLMTEEPF